MGSGNYWHVCLERSSKLSALVRTLHWWSLKFVKWHLAECSIVHGEINFATANKILATLYPDSTAVPVVCSCPLENKVGLLVRWISFFSTRTYSRRSINLKHTDNFTMQSPEIGGTCVACILIHRPPKILRYFSDTYCIIVWYGPSMALYSSLLHYVSATSAWPAFCRQLYN